MKSSYDAEADALYIRFSDGEIDGSREVAPGRCLKMGSLLKDMILKFDDTFPVCG